MTLARIISYVFHPVIMPTAGLLVAYFFNGDVSTETEEDAFNALLLLVGSISCLVVMMALIMMNAGIIKSLHAHSKEERMILYGAALLCYATAYFMITKNVEVISKFHAALLNSMLGAIIAIGAGLLITTIFKISTHMIGIAGVTGIMFALGQITFDDEGWAVFVCLVACGIVGSARMVLQAHSLPEVISGFFLGFLCTYGAVRGDWVEIVSP